MIRTQRLRTAFAFLSLAAAACWSVGTGCAVSLGPGYEVTKQQIEVQFLPGSNASPEPVIRLNAVYQLRNTGNQPLASIEVRLPGRRRFHYTDPQALWDKTALVFESSPENPRDTLFTFPQPWKVSHSHTLRLSADFRPANPGEDNLSFSSDAFFLPAQGWSPELLPSRGIFAGGGVPPKAWNLTVRVPSDFLVHMSGQPSHHSAKHSRDSNEQVLVAVQQLKDPYPFVIAGRYKTAKLEAGDETINLWTRSAQDPNAFRDAAGALVRAIRAYNATFGTRLRDSRQLFIVECPVVPGCFTSAASNYAPFVYGPDEKPSAEMASWDTGMVDIRAGPSVVGAAAAPALAASWLGYDQNPGFFEQTPPLSALPAFAAARGREAVEGSQVRAETIRRALHSIPDRTGSNSKQPESDAVLRAKSFLFFYALQDLYGQDAFNRALSHMLDARRGGGFDLDDLIAAFEEESHKNVAEFVREWMKHPGVPEEFRARYENSAALAATSKETMR